MGAEAGIIAKLLARLGPVAARELAPTAERLAPEAIESLAGPELKEILGKGGGWLEDLLRMPQGAGAVPAKVAPKAVPPGASPARPDLLERLSKLLGYEPYGQAYGEAAPRPAMTAKGAIAQPPPPGAPISKSAQPLPQMETPFARQPVAGISPEFAGTTKMPYRGRGAARLTTNIPPEEAFKTEGLKRGALLPEHQAMLKQMVTSGQLPPDVLGTEQSTRSLLAKLYGYKPKSLAGERQLIGEADPSTIGLQVKQYADMSPQEIIQKLGTTKISSLLKEAPRMAPHPEEDPSYAVQQALQQYQALGETRPPKEIITDLLRGGPQETDIATSPFAKQVLQPIGARRKKLGLPTGTPLSKEDIVGALGTSKFLRPTSQPSPVREDFLQKVLEKVKTRSKRGGV